MKSYFKKIIYLVVLYGYSAVNASPADDFFLAVKRNNAGSVSSLLSQGFDPNTLNESGESGLFLAVKEPSLNVVRILISSPKTNVELRNKRDESPLMLAALQGLADVCEQLIAKGADVNKPGWASLHYAATRGQVAVMNLLLENHAYIDTASPNGTTPLMMAARYGSTEAVKLLLEAGADASLKNEQRLTALDFAKLGERPDAIEILSAVLRASQPKGVW